MSKRVGWLLAAGAGMGMVAGAWGQSGERPLHKMFGGGSAKSSPAKAVAENAQRRAEIDVELAWLADAITFPYFLEARVDGGTLSVRGYVPDKVVREQALKLARVYTTYTIADNLKEHPSLRVHIAKESPAQLQAAVVSTLREALPRQYQRLQVQCGADGTVTLRGPVASPEEKLAASHALRRLYGCSSVQNQMQTPGDAETRPLPAVGFGPLVPTKEAEPRREPPAVTNLQGPSLLPPREPTPAPKETTSAKADLSPEKIAGLQKRVREACAGAKDVKIELTPANKVRIELTVASDDQITTFAGKVYGLSELSDYRDAVELYFTVGQEKK
jgi:osmotically-inducible protein OsmY